MYPIMAYIHFEQDNAYTEPFLQYQILRLYACAADRRWKIIQFYADVGHAPSRQRRPGFLSMREAMKVQNIFLVLTPSVRHIARGMFPLTFESASCYFYAVKEQLLLPLCPDALI